MTTTFFDINIAAAELEFTMAVIKKLSTFRPDDTAYVNCKARSEYGYLEWIISFENGRGQHVYTLGCVQRSVGAEVEFHS